MLITILQLYIKYIKYKLQPNLQQNVVLQKTYS